MRRDPCLLLALSLLVAAARAFAADPQPYEVTLKPTGNTALDQALKDASQLISLQKNAPVGPFALVTRAREDAEPLPDRAEQLRLLQGEGDTRRSPASRWTIPMLPDLLEQRRPIHRSGGGARFDLGPQFHLGAA